MFREGDVALHRSGAVADVVQTSNGLCLALRPKPPQADPEAAPVPPRAVNAATAEQLLGPLTAMRWGELMEWEVWHAPALPPAPEPPAHQGRARASRVSRSRAAPETLPCPVPGCCAGVDGGARNLALNTSLADRPYLCPCERRTMLRLGVSSRGWALHQHQPDQDARAEHNQIMHALLTGQAVQDRTWNKPTQRAADPSAARMGEAHLQSYSLAIRACEQLRDGRADLAAPLAEQALAAHASVQVHRRSYNRSRRADTRQGRWKNAERFYIEQRIVLPRMPRRTEGGQLAEPDPDAAQRFTGRLYFDFVAVWDDPHWVLENGNDLELRAGLQVGQDGWRELIRFLTRWDEKPGTPADPREAVYRKSKGTWELRSLVKQHYPRVPVALEAIRLTLRVQPEPPDPEAWLAQVMGG